MLDKATFVPYCPVVAAKNGSLYNCGKLTGLKLSINFLVMNKIDIANAVHQKLGGTKVQAEEVVDTVIESIVGTLKKGEEVSIAGLGIFATKTRAARQARNPRTGETISVPAMRVPKFRPAKALKDAVK